MRVGRPAVTGLALGAAIACAGCGGHRSVLDAGVRFDHGTRVQRITPAEAVRDARSAHAEWRREIVKRAREDPPTRFPNLAPFLFRQRLAEASRRYDFQVVSVRLLRPRGLAPEVVVRTRNYLELARAVPAIGAGAQPAGPG